MSNALDVTDGNFEQEVLKESLPVLVDFWAPWCGPCRMVAPIVDQIATEFAGRLKVVKVNTDDNPETSSKFGIMSIPTLLLFKDGKNAEQIVGAVQKAQLLSKISPHLS